MAIGTGISFTLSDALQEADKLDNHFNKWVQQSIEINANMRKAFTSKSTGEVATGLRDLKGLIDGIAGKTISPKTNAEDVQKLGDALDRVAKAVDLLANENIELFDTKGLYDTEKSLAETSAELSTVLDKISKLKNLWKEVSSWDIDKSAEALRASSGYQLTPEQAIAAAKQAQEIKKQEIEDELRIEIEKKAIAQKELQWAKKTQDEKAQYIQKKLDEIFKAEEQQANKISAEYKRLNQELRNTVTSRSAIEEASQGKHMMSSEKETYDALVNYESELRQQILQMENDHLEQISDLRISYAVKDAKNIADIIKKRQYSATDALTMASNARTGDEMERAKDAVKSALMTVDKDDLDTIDELNKAYLNLRASIEKLTKAQKNEQTLQPSIRNEYRRILKELDDLHAAQERLRNTDAYKGLLSTQDAQDAADAMAAFDAREKDLLDKKVKYEQEAGNLLDEVVRENAKRQADIRLQEFEKAQKELEAKEKKYGSITSFEADQVIWDNSHADNVRKSQKAIEELTEARDKLNKYDSDYEHTLDSLNKEIKKHEEFIESVTNAERYREQQAKKVRETYQGAMDYSKQAKSINDLKEAIRVLDVARQKEDLSTRQGKKNYRELTRELEAQQNRYDKLTQKVKSSSKGLIDTAGQLKRAFGLLFSVSQIRGYIHQIIEVRGEFEMQHRSMQVLIGDIDKANELWDKTISLATKSPFRVKELVTYTKQLAAYRVEADKLYETNKMLADISSGLGVDMNRLILAFGQVKAANYLRGTELRQFSEAGINILELLAKRFEEVQGRAISTGEVFEMVSKRLVSFEDVNAVLQQVTSEGGMFYQMQEKQSETLQGMVRNLRDSIDLMMNDMGISMNDELKNAVALVKNLVDEWRKLVPIIASLGVAMLFNTARKGLLFLIGGIDKMIKGFSRLKAASSAAAAVNPWLLLATVIASVTTAVIAARKEMNRLAAAMGQVESNNKKQLTESISLYRKLAESVTDATKTELEREKAMANLKQRFGEILPDSLLEVKYVKQLGTNYEEANRAMMAYYDAKTREQKKDKVDAMFESDIYEKAFPKLISGLKHITKTTSALTEEQKILVESYAGNIFGDIIDSAKNGEIEVENLFDTFKKRLSEYTEIEASTIDEMFHSGGSKWVEDRLEDLGGLLEKYQNTLSGITGLSYTTRSEEVAMEWKNAEKANLEAIMAEYKKFATYYHQFSTANVKEREKIANSVSLSLSQVPEELALYKPHLEKAVNDLKEAAEGGAWSFASSMQKIEQSFVKGLKYIVSRSVNAQEYDAYSHAGKFLVNFATNMNEGIDKAAEDLDLSKFQEGIIDGIGKVVEKTKVSVDEFAKYLPKMGESLSDVKNRVSGDIEVLKTRVEDYTTSISTGLDKTSIISDKILNENPEQIKYFENSLIPALQLFLQLLGDAEKHKGGGGSSLMDERIKVVDDMNRAYTELNKTLSKNEALEGAFAKYKDAFQKAYAGTTLLPKNFGSMTAEQFLKEFNFTTEEGMVGFFDKLIAYAKKTGEQVDVELAKGEYIMEARVELKKDEDKKLLDSIQELFDQYDLSLELKKLNIPPDLARSLFDVDYLDLDKLRSSVIEVFSASGQYGYKLKDLGEKMEATFKGNVDLLNRQLIPATKLAEKGWKDVGEGIATVFSSQYGIKDSKGETTEILVTPILPDGTVLSEKELEDYIHNTLEGAENILKADEKGLVISVGVNARDGESLHLMQEEYYNFVKLAKTEQDVLVKELNKKLSDVDWNIVGGLLSKDQAEQVKKRLEEIGALADKQQLESAKRFAKFLTKNLDQTKVVLQQRGIDIAFAKKEFDEGRISAEQFAETVKNIVAQSNEEISKLNLEKFKETPEYIQAMGNLAAYSVQELQALKVKLQDLISANGEAFSAEEMLVYQRVLEKIGERIDLLDDNLWFKDSDVEALRDIKRLEGEINEEKEKEAKLTARLTTLEAERASLVAQLSILEQQRKDARDKGEDTTAIDTQILGITSQIETKNAEILKVQGSIKKTKTILAELGEELDRILDGQTKAMAKVEAGLNIFNKSLALAMDTYADIKEVADSFGADTEGTGWQQAENVMSMLQGFGGNAASAAGKFATGDIFGGIMDSAKAIKELIVGINKIHDTNLEDTIQKNLEEVDNLKKKYEQLEWAIDRAFSFKKYGMVAEQQENLAKQIENTQKAIAAEEAKKDTDKDRIEELQGEIEEASKQIQELYDNLRADIVGTFEDLSSTLGDAMISALQQGEDALKAWSDSVNDIITDIVGQLLIQKYLEPQIANLVNDYYSKIMPKNARAENKYQEYLKAIERGDSSAAEKLIEEYKKLAEQAIGEVPQINEDATKQFQSDLLAAGENFKDLIPDWLINSTKEGGGLSALQKGIQGITSDQAEILSAYWNSVRGYTASIDSKMDLILANMGVGTENNPMLEQLISQTSWLSKIHGILEDVASASPRAFKTALM